MEDLPKGNMGIKTALHQAHLDNAAKLVNYSGHCMPLHYGSPMAEHQAVRDSAGMFDVSHMCLLDIHGEGATGWLRTMLSNDVARLDNGNAQYTCLCLENGGVIDDLLVFRISDYHYRLYVDAARRIKDLAWLNAHLASGVEIIEVEGNCIVAIQGPDAIRLTSSAIHDMGLSIPLATLSRFSALSQDDWFVARTGYTGEDGIEITLPAAQAAGLWHALAEQGVAPAGLGARETLRLEAGFGLYGQDIDERYSPAESGMARTIDISDEDRAFIGRDILEDHKRFGGRFFQIGLTLDGQGLLRRGAKVELVGRSIGKITSGSFSPTRAASVGLARVSRKFTGSCDVAVRDRLLPASITSVPFVPHGIARE